MNLRWTIAERAFLLRGFRKWWKKVMHYLMTINHSSVFLGVFLFLFPQKEVLVKLCMVEFVLHQRLSQLPCQWIKDYISHDLTSPSNQERKLVYVRMRNLIRERLLASSAEELNVPTRAYLDLMGMDEDGSWLEATQLPVAMPIQFDDEADDCVELSNKSCFAWEKNGKRLSLSS